MWQWVMGCKYRHYLIGESRLAAGKGRKQDYTDRASRDCKEKECAFLVLQTALAAPSTQ